jgi:hypothetical protein
MLVSRGAKPMCRTRGGVFNVDDLERKSFGGLRTISLAADLPIFHSTPGRLTAQRKFKLYLLVLKSLACCPRASSSRPIWPWKGQPES